MNANLTAAIAAVEVDETNIDAATTGASSAQQKLDAATQANATAQQTATDAKTKLNADLDALSAAALAAKLP